MLVFSFSFSDIWSLLTMFYKSYLGVLFLVVFGIKDVFWSLLLLLSSSVLLYSVCKSASLLYSFTIPQISFLVIWYRESVLLSNNHHKGSPHFHSRYLKSLDSCASCFINSIILDQYLSWSADRHKRCSFYMWWCFRWFGQDYFREVTHFSCS